MGESGIGICLLQLLDSVFCVEALLHSCVGNFC